MAQTCLRPQQYSDSGAVPESPTKPQLCRRQAMTMGWYVDCGIYRKLATDYWNHAKQHQTSYTASDATPGASLLQGDALITYENLKRENNCKGMESEGESMSKMDVGDVCICVSSDCKMGTNWPQWHWTRNFSWVDWSYPEFLGFIGLIWAVSNKY